MTDKVQKIREEIERLKSQLIKGACASQIAMETRCKEEAYNEVLAVLDSLQEDPVSEDLEEEVHNFPLHYHGDIVTDEDGIHLCDINESKLLEIANHFANWQKEQFKKNRLAACNAQTEKEAEIESDFVMSIIENEHRQPTFDDAIKYGMKLREEQMIEDAFEREIKVDSGGYPYIPQIELYDYDKDIPLAKKGNRYKVILIKGE